jgi:DNA replication factor GINS
MYNELNEVWKRELESGELEKLSSDFYSRIADYLRRLKEESRMLDKRTMKANLLEKEAQNVIHMARDLIRARYKKIVKKAIKGEKVQSNTLTVEEEKIYAGFSSLTDTYSSFAKNILRGYMPKIEAEQAHKRAVLRFLRDVPAIIGTDMKTYGPFRIEDVASLPIKNAKVLVKQALAEKVELGQL